MRDLEVQRGFVKSGGSSRSQSEVSLILYVISFFMFRERKMIKS
jgi:hypothetical protein